MTYYTPTPAPVVIPVVVTPPTRYAANIVEVKEHLRVLHDVEDNLLTGYIATATNYFGWLTGLTPYETEWEIALDRFPSKIIELPAGNPLISVTSVKYKDSTGTETTLAGTEYAVDTHNGRITPAYGKDWPSFTPYPLSAVKIRYKAGLVVTEALPPGIRECVCEMVGGLHEIRESVVTVDRVTVAFAENPITKRLLTQFKRSYAF